ASKLGKLGLQYGVTRVVVDSPVHSTGLISPTSLVTLFPVTSGATAAWQQNLTGQGVGVAVIDSGVTPNASDLGTRVTQVKLPSQNGGSNLMDAVGHGPFVADVL